MAKERASPPHNTWLVRAFSSLLLTWISLAAALEPNQIENGGLDWDRDRDGVADGWQPEVHITEGAAGSFVLDRRQARFGRGSQRIQHYSDSGWVRVSQDLIPAAPNCPYLFQCWVLPQTRFVVILYTRDETGRYRDLWSIRGKARDGNRWERIQALVVTPPSARWIKVSLVTETKGIAWFDEVELVPLSPPPTILVPRRPDSPVLDGRLDDPCWKDLEPLDLFLNIQDQKPVAVKTVARMFSNSENLFLSFFCEEPSPQRMKLGSRQRGEPAYQDDCVEVYLSDNRQDFIQLVVTAEGNVFSQKATAEPITRHWWSLPSRFQIPWSGQWRTATHIGPNYWSAEIAIPLKEVPNLVSGSGGINLCRSRKAGDQKEESAFAYLAPASFQRTSAFPILMLLHKVPETRRSSGRVADDQVLIPAPQRLIKKKGGLTVRQGLDVLVFAPDDPLIRSALWFFQSKTGLPIRWRFATRHQGDRKLPTLTIATPDQLPSSAPVPAHLPTVLQFLKQRGEESYFLLISPDRESVSRSSTRKRPNKPGDVWLIGSTSRGLRNGLMTLFHLVGNALSNKDLGVLPACEIWDYPDLSFRAWHTVAPLEHQLPIYERFLDLLVSLKFNAWVIEVNDRFPYRSHPQIPHPRAPTREQLAQFLKRARSLGVEVVPQVQSFGHFEYVLSQPSYAHLSELKDPDPRWGFYSYCPSNPETYKVLFDLMDEVIEVFQPTWFHIGHDEITFVPMAVCPRCKGQNPWDLLASDIIRIYQHLKKRGIEKVCLWCDQLEPSRTGGPPYNTYLAADQLPKDLVIFCWHYEPARTYPWLTRLREKGFATIACPWYHASNIWTFARESLDRKALGLCGTTWYDLSGFENQIDLMTSLIVGSENSWSVEIPPLSRAPHPGPVIQDLLALLGYRSHWVSKTGSFQVLDISPWANKSLFEPSADPFIRDRDSRLASVDQLIGYKQQVPFLLPKFAGDVGVVALSHQSQPTITNFIAIPINRKVRSLYFLWTTSRRPIPTETLYERGATDPRRVAILTVHNQDGTSFHQRLIYRRHITEWTDRLGCSEARLVYQGRTDRGQIFSLCAYRWDNPSPEQPIQWIALSALPVPVTIALLAITLVD